MNISERFCPVCKNKNEYDAVVCRFCGARLDKYYEDGAGKTRTTDMQTPGTGKTGKPLIDEAMIPVGGIAIYIEDIPKHIFSYFGNEFVLVRKAGGEVPGALLDLSPWGGYHLGLSRRHAMIRRTALGYEVIDLSSTNGTWLNDQKLLPNKPYPLTSGSQLRLGRMRFFILYRSLVETKQKA